MPAYISQDLLASGRDRGSLISVYFWLPTTFPYSHAGRTGIFRTWFLGTSLRRKLEKLWQNHTANASRGTTGSPGIQMTHLSFTGVTSCFDVHSYPQAHTGHFPSTCLFSSWSNCQGLCIPPPFLHSNPALVDLESLSYSRQRARSHSVHFSTHVSFSQRVKDFS